MTLEFSMPSFLCITLLMNVFSADPLLLKIPPPPTPKKKRFLASVLVLNKEQNKDSLMVKKKQKQFRVGVFLGFALILIPCFAPFFEDIKIRVSD